MLRNQQVVRYGERWAVRREGNTRVTAVYNSKEKAVIEARRIVGNTGSSVMICSSRHSSDEAKEMERRYF